MFTNIAERLKGQSWTHDPNYVRNFQRPSYVR
jgi:hypothetical protein